MQISDVKFVSSVSGPGPTASASPSRAPGAQFDPGRVALVEAFGQATELGSALGELDQLISTAQPRRARAAWAGSSAALLLGSEPLTATTMRSTQEVNATPTSFEPTGPDYAWQGPSVAPPAVEGIYDGSNGTGTMTFEARRNGVHGENNLRFRVREPGGAVIDNVLVHRNDPLDQQYLLSNGLIFTLGAGSVERRDTFTVEVFADVGSVVHPDKPLDGQGSDKPNLQYGFAVNDGSFDINGVSIAVSSSDSINDVLARISASAADVSALFDPATETVLLTRLTPGSDFDITLENDTSGFLAATKLDSAVADRGTDGGPGTPIGELLQFDAVSSGVLRINDVDVALDINADSLEDILERISDSDAIASARLINDRIYLQTHQRTDTLVLDDGGTGLFDALYIASGRYEPVRRDGVSLARAEEIAATAVEVRSAINRLLGDIGNGGLVPAEVLRLRGQMQGVLDSAGAALDGDSTQSPGLDITAPGASQSSSVELDVTALVSSLRTNFSEVRGLFLGETADARQGFVRQLLDVVNQFTSGLRTRYGITGILTGLSA